MAMLWMLWPCVCPSVTSWCCVKTAKCSVQTSLHNVLSMWLTSWSVIVLNTSTSFTDGCECPEFRMVLIVFTPVARILVGFRSGKFTAWKVTSHCSGCKLTHVIHLVIISITRYRDIDRGFVERTISWRPYIVWYRARTHISRVRCSHTAAAASDWCRSPCTPSVDWLPLPHFPCGRPIMQCIGSLGWGLWDGSCTSAERPTLLVVPRRVKVVMISTLQRLSSVHSLWHPPAAVCVRVSVTWHQSWSPSPCSG